MVTKKEYVGKDKKEQKKENNRRRPHLSFLLPTSPMNFSGDVLCYLAILVN